MLKRRRLGGTALFGGAAKNHRRALLVRSGAGAFSDKVLDELIKSVGLPGQVTYTAHSPYAMMSTLPPQPQASDIVVTTGRGARDVLLAYHGSACSGSPDTEAGIADAVERCWSAPMHRLALEGKAVGSKKVCNAVVCLHMAGEHAGLLAMHVDADVRMCIVQAIHIMPKFRGPWQFSRRMWELARSWVAERARVKKTKLVRFSLEMACSHSQQGCSSRLRAWGGMVPQMHGELLTSTRVQVQARRKSGPLVSTSVFMTFIFEEEHRLSSTVYSPFCRLVRC